jgi:hypothetical protein
VNAGVNRAGGSRSSGANDASVNYSGVHVTRLRLTATTVFISVDGGAETSGASSLSADVTPFTIGSWSSANYWGGKINWIGITAPLSAGNATSLLAYLKARGGVP